MLNSITRRPLCLLCLLFLFAVYAFVGNKEPQPRWPVDEFDGRCVCVAGTVSDRLLKNGTFYVYVRDVSFDGNGFPEGASGITVKLSEAEAAQGRVKIGSKIKAKGVFAPYEKKRCEGCFDARSYYKIKGYDGQLNRARLIGISVSYDRVAETLRIIRGHLSDVLYENMSEDDAALVSAMTLGDKSGLDLRTKELYQNAGISHVLALSGLHIASVGLAILGFLKKIRVPGNLAGGITFGIISCYAVMTGMSTSTVRAMIMFGLFVLAKMCSRTYDLLSAASASALIVLSVNPYLLYDTGFLLSFGAVAGIAVIFPLLIRIPQDLLKNDEKKEPGKLYGSLCISLSVMVATLPVMGMSFMQISLFSVIINLLVIPLMSVVLLSGFGGMTAGLIGLFPAPILMITHYILCVYRSICEFTETIDGNIFLIGEPSKWQIITYAIIVVCAVIVRIAADHKERLLPKNVDRDGRHYSKDNGLRLKNRPDKITYIIKSSSDRSDLKKKNCAISLITVVMLIAAGGVLLIHPLSDLEIRNVDVGQGDCCLIWGSDVPTVMIDGGSSDIKNVAANRIIPVLKANRIRCIDHCFITHPDSDHINGVIEMLESPSCFISIKRVYINHTAVDKADSPANYERLVAAAKKRGTKIVYVRAGDRLSFGNVRLFAVSPLEGKQAFYADTNDASTVLYIQYDDDDGRKVFSGLVTGDIGEGAEKLIAGSLSDITYLKVAHHGSRYSSSGDFLRRVTPDISVISAGVDNSYGHPHDETLSRLSSAGTRIYRTDKEGEIILKLDDGHVRIHTALTVHEKSL